MTNNTQVTHATEITPDLLITIDKQDLKEVTYEDLIQMGIDLSEVKGYTQWLLGKLGDTVTGSENSKKGDLKDYAFKIGQKYAVLNQYVYTYRKFIKEDPAFHPNKYYGSVPWGVLALVATKKEKPQTFIEELREQNKEVSLEMAYREIKRQESPNEAEPPKKPSISLYWDKNKQLYKLVMDSADFPLIDWSSIKEDLRSWLEGLS